MIRFIGGTFHGLAKFELTGGHAAALAHLLELPVEPTRMDSGIIVTLYPRALDAEEVPSIIDEGGSDANHSLDEAITRRAQFDMWGT